jgi:hypothetical protein
MVARRPVGGGFHSLGGGLAQVGKMRVACREV